ncbi:hypothetical protein Tco_1482078 [Tanacetum coccineum]
MTFKEISNFASLFQLDQRVSALESVMSEFRQKCQFAEAFSLISGIVDTYLASKMKEAVDVAVQLQTNKLKEEAQAENQEFLNQVDSTMKAIIKELVQAQVSKIIPNIRKYITESIGAKVGRDDQDKDEDPFAKSQPKSSGKSTHAEEHDQKAADLENQPHQEFNTGNKDVSPVREALNKDVWHRNPLRPPTPDHSQSLFNEFLATPIDFSAFIMHRLKIDNLTQEVLTDPTYDLIKGTYKSVVELEYHLEEVFKATNDRLDWHNPEGKPYPHEQGHQVIPLDHFINNELEYLKGGRSIQKYTTSITKTKAADYGQVKWIEDKNFYGYASNMETSKDVYSRHMIIAVNSLKIMKWFGYSHLEEIIVQRKDDQLYKFREGNFKRLRRQDLEDMLILLVQDKLTNLNLEERNRLMRTDELHKFSDGTLNHDRTALNYIALRIEMEYLPKRKWSKQDRKRACVMINAINKKLRDRRLMRSLEKFVGERPYGGDLRLLERTI